MFLDYIPSYDEHRRIEQVKNRNWYDGAELDTLARYDYSFDKVGNRLEIDPRRGGGANADGFSKMQEIPTIDYDGLHRLTQVDYDLGTTQSEVFEYDDLGNRVTYQDERNSVTTLYTANEANEYLTVGGYTVAHDAAGNLTSQIIDGTAHPVR